MTYMRKKGRITEDLDTMMTCEIACSSSRNRASRFWSVSLGDLYYIYAHVYQPDTILM